MEIYSWLLFSSIALVATITPGPAVLLVATHSISHGTQRTLFTILGNISGLFIMSLLSVLGLGALVLCSSAAFAAIKIIGALYLIFLGIRLWRSGFLPRHHEPGNKLGLQNVTGRKLYTQGVLVALSNPKAIAFTTALFPQFIDHQQSLPLQFGILVTTFMAYSFICLFIYARLSEKTQSGIHRSRYDRVVSRIFASLFIGSGVGLTISS